MKLLHTYMPFQVLLGVLLGILWSPNITVLVCGILFLGVLFFIPFVRKHLFFCWIVSLGLVMGGLSSYLDKDTNHPHHYSKLKVEKGILRLRISQSVKTTASIQRFYAEVYQLDTLFCVGKVLLEIPKKEEESKELRVGDELVCRGVFKNIHSPISPYDFNYKEYLYRKGINARFYVHHYRLIGKSKKVWDRIKRWRGCVANKLHHSQFSDKTKALLAAMLLGNKAYISEELRTSFTNSGVVHLIAISGMHVGILYLLIFQSLRFLKRWTYGRYLQIFITIFLLYGFAIFSGGSSSVMRAVTMFSFFLLAKLTPSQRMPYEPVVTSMLVLLLCCPNYLYAIGFQLSYAAVISIVVFYPLCTQKWYVKNKVVKYFMDVLMVSMLAQLGVLPLTLYYFHQIPLQFLGANFFAVSLLPIVLLGGIFMIAKLWLLPRFVILDIGYDAFVQKYLHVIHFFSSLENWIVKDVFFTSVHVWLCYAFLALLAWLLMRFNYKKMLSLLICIGVFQVYHWRHKYQNHQKETLLIYNHYKPLTVAIQAGTKLYTNKEVSALNAYKITHQIEDVIVFQDPVFVFKEQLYIIVNASLTYDQLSVIGATLILDNNPHINLERVLISLKPKNVILTNFNYKRNLQKWKQTCQKQNVPFYDIHQQGAYVVH